MASAVLTLLLAFAASPCAAYVAARGAPAAVRARPLQPASRVRAPAVVMFGGDDKFLEASLDAGGLPAKLGTPVGKLAMQGIVIASAAGGWVLTPSVRPVVKGVFAAAAGGVGLIARKRLMSVRRQAASPVLAQLLSKKGVANVGYDEALELAKSYGVAEADFPGQLAELYSIYLSGCLRSAQAKTSELSDLLTMMRAFKLSFDVVGDATFAAASRFYSEQRAYFQADDEHEAKQKLDKLVFLADRTLGEDPSEEGFRYEKTRLSKKLGLAEAEWVARVERVAAPFYRELLTTILKDPSKVSEKDLAAVGAQLGLSEQSTLKMKLDELRRHVTKTLETSGAKFTPSQLEKLEAIRASYGLTEDACREVLEGVVTPFYAAALNEVVAELAESETDQSAQLLGKLATRQQELSLSTSGARRRRAGDRAARPRRRDPPRRRTAPDGARPALTAPRAARCSDAPRAAQARPSSR